MAVTVVGYASGIATRIGGSVLNQTLTFNLPVGTQEGDCVVLTVGCVNLVTSGLSGWTEHDEVTTPPPSTSGQAIATANSRESVLWYRFVPASVPASYTIGMSGDTCGGIAVLRGVDPADPIDDFSVATDGNTVSSALVLPSLDTTIAGCHMVGFASGMNHRTWSTPTGMTERWELHTPGSDTGPTDGHIGHTFFDEALGAAGATGTRTTTPSGATSRMGALVAFRPATPVEGEWWVGPLRWTEG